MEEAGRYFTVVAEKVRAINGKDVKSVGNMPIIFSFTFFISFAIYLFLGIHTFQMNPRERINRYFFFVCLLLAIWSLGFSIANFAPDAESCLAWRRFSAIGWASVYATFLYFFLILSKKSKESSTSKLHYLIYLPAIIFVYAFSLSNKITSSQFNFVRADFGWINKAVQNNWTAAFNIYYIGYVLACLVVLKTWHWTAKDKDTRKGSNIIFYSLFAALLLGTITDVVISSYLSSPLPQMAPIFIVIPMLNISSFLKKNRIIEEQKENTDELILSHKSQTKYFYHLATVLFAGGLLGMLTLLLPNLTNTGENFTASLIAGGVLFVLGTIVIMLQFFKSDKVKNITILIISLCLIPFITLSFISYAGITVWAISLIVTMASLAFNNKKPLYLIMVVSMITQGILWYLKPKQTLVFDEIDYVIRMGLILITFWIGTIISNIYMKRLKENKSQIEFQKVVSEISTNFVNIKQSNFDDKVYFMLEKMGRFFDVDKTTVFFIDPEKENMKYYKEWLRDNDNGKDEPIEYSSWVVENFKDKQLFIIEDTRNYIYEREEMKDYLLGQKIKSLIIIPVAGERDIMGFIGLGSVLSYRKWSDYQVSLLKILSNLLADGFSKVKSEKEIEYMAYYDHLTGLPNRTLFTDRLDQAVKLAKRNASLIGVVFIDLDSFKSINDTMGHSGGDNLLQTVGENIKRNIRESDTVARFGGDEFLILLNNIDKNENIVKIINKIMWIFKEPYSINGHTFFISCSIGISVFPYDGDDAEALIKNADIAMYRAKAKGKNQYVLCTKDMKDEVQRNVTLSNDLYRALEKDELSLHYQPQINLVTGKIIGLEALLRWQHPKFGMVPPNVFIPLAEKNGLINPIGKWVIETAAAQNKKWQKMNFSPLRMSVNLSAAQFNDPYIVATVDKILRDSKLSPEYFEIEITESIAVKEAMDSISILSAFKQLGISIAIDDFGTEYSSLGRLKQLPIDRIKIDMQFIQAIENSKKDKAITDVIINLAKNLELQVIAEGVETKTQLEFLNQKQCDDVQGYYFYKPMPVDEIEKILTSLQK